MNVICLHQPDLKDVIVTRDKGDWGRLTTTQQ